MAEGEITYGLLRRWAIGTLGLVSRVLEETGDHPDAEPVDKQDLDRLNKDYTAMNVDSIGCGPKK